MKKVLLINASYEPIGFINDKRAIKLLVKENKVEVLSAWDEFFTFASGKIQLPSVLKLVTRVERLYHRSNFTRRTLAKRDESKCQYCSKKLSASQITVDHVIPTSLGGKTSFTNCVISCFDCNNRKGNRTPVQAKLTLIKEPIIPPFTPIFQVDENQQPWHSDWNSYLANYI